MTLADALPAKKPLLLRHFSSTYAGLGPKHQFVGSLLVPKHSDDGRYPIVDVWTAALTEVVIVPAALKVPMRMPKLFIGASELNHLMVHQGHRLMHIDTARGVEPVGYGFGFALYAATALAVKFAGPDGLYSFMSTRSIDASELWARMRKMSFSWMGGPLAKEAYLKYDGINYILGQTVLDSGLVVRLGEKYGRQWASFRKPPTTNFAWDLKYRAKKLGAWERYMNERA